jgi:hypothetical protein
MNTWQLAKSRKEQRAVSHQVDADSWITLQKATRKAPHGKQNSTKITATV